MLIFEKWRSWSSFSKTRLAHAGAQHVRCQLGQDLDSEAEDEADDADVAVTSKGRCAMDARREALVRQSACVQANLRATR